MSRLDETDRRFESANVTLFLVLGAMSFCERLESSLLAQTEDQDAGPIRETALDEEHPAHLVALGLESFGRTVRSLCDTSASEVEGVVTPRPPVVSPPFRRLLR